MTAWKNSKLMSLPGYRPTTSSSACRSQAGGRSSYLSPCHEESEPQENWTRIAELQKRNQACPPHLKSSYPVESWQTLPEPTITDDELTTGDPKETLRQATLLPSQIQESVGSTRSMTLASTGMEHSWAGSSITPQQQRKRVSEEPHDTPESKKSASCFPRQMTPKKKPETRRSPAAESRVGSSQQQSQLSRHQTLAYSIVNTPKKLGSSLLKRGLNKKSTPKSTPQGRGCTSKSPHLAIRKSPNRKSPRGAGKSPKNRKWQTFRELSPSAQLESLPCPSYLWDLLEPN
ncbi:nuclear mitotic apparatus protein 1-like [Anomaloglossus baeobatrachus]|uniref:nuclear mitotic apparatus protein 1-like n=1 Tax=Anomaloglossus baeobatrachus TaxID=238106 RepID=UPI003F5085C2